MPVKPIPDGYSTITPMLIADDPAALLRFVEAAFDTQRLNYLAQPGGSLMASDIRIGTSSLSICAAGGDMPAYKAVLYIYIEDVDKAYARALQAGATGLQEPKNESHGDRMGGFADPAGNQWWIATRVEDLSDEELARRMAAHTEEQGTAG